MKNTNPNQNNQNQTHKSDNAKAVQPKAQGNRNRPENKDNLDHREGLENDTKGDDITHNEKETKAKHLKEK